MDIFWILMDGGEYSSAVGVWWWMVVDIFLLPVRVDGGGYIVVGGELCWVVVNIFWLVVGRGRSW